MFYISFHKNCLTWLVSIFSGSIKTSNFNTLITDNTFTPKGVFLDIFRYVFFFFFVFMSFHILHSSFGFELKLCCCCFCNGHCLFTQGERWLQLLEMIWFLKKGDLMRKPSQRSSSGGDVRFLSGNNVTMFSQV